METVSRRLKAAFFIYWGRFNLPLGIPTRAPITLLIGELLDPGPPTPSPSQQQIDALHERLLASIERSFDTHKAAVGWAHKRMKFV